MRISLSQKVAVTAVVLFCLGFGPLLMVTTNTLRNNLTKVLGDQLQTSVGFVANDLEQKFQLRIHALQSVASHIPASTSGDVAAVTHYLSTRFAITELFSSGLVLIDRNGQLIAEHPPMPGRLGSSFKAFEFFQDAMTTGRPAIGRPGIGRFSGKPGVAIGVPVKDEAGQTVGVIGGFVGLTDSSVFDQTYANLGNTGEYVLVSVKDRLVIVDKDNSHVLKPVEDTPDLLEFNRIFSEKNGNRVVNQFHGKGMSLIAQHAMFNGDWMALAVLPTQEAFQPITEMTRLIYSVAVGALLLVAGALWWLLIVLFRPLTGATRELRAMVFEGVALHELTVTRDDEVGDLLKVFNKLQSDMTSKQTELEIQAQRDFLTGLLNRRHFVEVAQIELIRTQRYGRQLAFFMLDVDHFKKVNDTHGHHAGDDVLCQLSKRLTTALREVDVIARMGGEEFAVLLPETNAETAVDVAERLREYVAQTDLVLDSGVPLRITVSIGVALLQPGELSLDELMNRADRALYIAKQRRNAVSLHVPDRDVSAG